MFTTDSKIFESGSSDGSYAHYFEHRLAAEFKAFKSFSFSDYKQGVQVIEAYAFTSEIYNYKVKVAKDRDWVQVLQ